MILDELTLHNFGVYGGRQTITLTPTEQGRPITLFGGLNGGGKTTLLDALQLCLYGSSARCSNRQSLTYEEFLRRSIHRGAAEPEAAIEIAFRHTANGEEQRFRLHRSWRATANGCRERFHVLRDDNLDVLATEHWGEQVEDFIPARIAHLFLFDGEKVESYAELDGAPALIATAIQNLLGLDIVERLTADLLVLERRKRIEARPDAEDDALSALRQQIASLDGARQRLALERATAQNGLDRRIAELNELEARYRREGGTLFDQRAELENQATDAERSLSQLRRELRDFAAGSAPLLLLEGLLGDTLKRSAREQLTRNAREAASALADEHDAILKLPELAAIRGKQRAALVGALARRLDERRQAASAPILLDLSPDAQSLLSSLVTDELPRARDLAWRFVRAEQQASRAFETARDALAAVPSHDAIADLVAQREGALAEVTRLQSAQQERDQEIARLDRELAQLRERATRLAEADARRRFEREDLQRLMQHSVKVRATLDQFREAVVARHVARIERLVLESFQQLIRKRTLIAGLRIDPQTFELELRGAGSKSVTPERLSAGERQLLAIAILWGLAKASGRPLPTVIDTPLGRLDSIHRGYLVKRYFPNASHQVLLLSTDEEIAGPYYEALRPAIGRTYSLRFDEQEGRTIVEPGYLGEKEPAHAD